MQQPNNPLHGKTLEAILNYLVEQGIDKMRMTYRGFAGRYPLVFPEVSEEDRTLNRRVEIKIVKK